MAAAATGRADDGVSARPDERGFVDRIHRDAEGDHKYVVFVPEGEPPQEGWPVILFLHGAGERGTDGRRQLSVGLGPLVKLRAATFPAVVVFPQSENLDGPILRSWSPDSPDGRRALAILAAVERDYPTNPTQRVLTGWSMGGVGTWGMAAADPDRWSAVVPVSGGGNPELAPQLTDVPIWAFHGDEDQIVSVAGTREMVRAVREAGGHILYSEIAHGGHDIWRRVYDSDDVLKWMLAPETDRPEVESIELPQDRTRAADVPFAPAMIVERAMTVRLGEDAVKIIATGLPASLQAKGLSGELDDVTDRVELDGRTFDVRFGELAYSAELERAIIRAYGADRVQAEIGMRNVHLHVGRIAVSDGQVGFTAGPAEVVVGHREPVWLRVEVRPAIDSGRLALKLLRSSFEIPDFNWFVREPEAIQLQGNWLTKEEVKTAVVGGIYVRRQTIEAQVLAAVPTMLDQFGEKVDLTPLERIVEALWPLPVYRPDVRVLPESIATDARGVSLTFSVAVASMDASPPASVRTVPASGPPAYDIAQTTDLRVGVAVDVMDHISSLLDGTAAARIFATDIPGQPFVELTDPAALADALPEVTALSPGTEVQTALVLDAPLRLRPRDQHSENQRPPDNRPGTQDQPPDGDALGILIEAPRLAMHVFAVMPTQAGEAAHVAAVAEPASLPQGSNRRKLFEGDIALQQPLSLQTVEMENGHTGLRVLWESEAEVSVAADEPQTTSEPGDGDRHDGHVRAKAMAQLFSRGWQRWTSSQADHIVPVPDVALGSAAMTLRELSWAGTRLLATYAHAPTRIINTTDSDITYQVRGPYSRWSKPRTLAAGASASFKTGVEVHLRPMRHWDFDEVTLPASSVWECRSGEQGGRSEWVRTNTSHPSPPASGLLSE